MFRPLTRTRYALHAMIALSLHEGAGPVLLRDIATAQRVSPKYLEQLAIPLRRAELLNAERGPNGGYELARPAEEITAREVVEALEGPIDLLDWVRTPRACDRAEAYAARGLWARVGRAITEVLAETTLADLCEEERAAQAEGAACYQI